MSVLEAIINHELIVFNDLISHIDTTYTFTPTAFTNGELENTASENQGSQKVFAFAKLHNLTKEQTLYCFGEHYQNVLATPEGDNHGNIRNFIKHGWAGYSASGTTLLTK